MDAEPILNPSAAQHAAAVLRAGRQTPALHPCHCVGGSNWAGVAYLNSGLYPLQKGLLK
jgi:hypothetical protein